MSQGSNGDNQGSNSSTNGNGTVYTGTAHGDTVYYTETTTYQTEIINVNTVYNYDWGEGPRQFPLVLTGSADYTCLFYLLVAIDAACTQWQTIPSIGVDAVKVQGNTTWKTIQFRQVDLQNLLDENGVPLLQGGRRVNFKVVLASEVTGVTMTGMSYRTQSTSKK